MLPPSNDRGRPGEKAASNVLNSTTILAPVEFVPRISGSVYVDLTDVDEDKQRLRVAGALQDSPSGARVVLYVGPLRVNPDVLSIVWEYGRHVDVEVSGHAFAVKRWVEAIRNGLGVTQ